MRKYLLTLCLSLFIAVAIIRPSSTFAEGEVMKTATDNCSLSQGKQVCQTHSCNSTSSTERGYTRITTISNQVPLKADLSCDTGTSCKPFDSGGTKGIQCVKTANIAPPSDAVDPSECKVFDGYTVCPGVINQGKVFTVEVTLKAVPKPGKDEEYFFCFLSDTRGCAKNALFSTTKPSYNQFLTGQVTVPPEITDNKDNEGTEDLRFVVCAAGEGALKMGDCAKDGSDWFHAGKTYRITLFDQKDDPRQVVRSAAFYVQHFYPEVVIPTVGERQDLNIETAKKQGKLTIPLELTGRNKAGKDNNQFNDYWIQVEGYDDDYQGTSQCLYIPSQKEAATAKVGQSGKIDINIPYQTLNDDGKAYTTLTEGTYIIKIKDGKNGSFGRNKLGFYDPNIPAHCSENDFIYYYIPISISSDGPGFIGGAIKDPKGKEVGLISSQYPTPIPLCKNKDPKTGYCESIQTALGPISTTPEKFVRNLFTIVLSIGGIAAIVFFIQAGYTIMTSAGNKEKVGRAREQITAAVTGLIFIILSIAILEFIGINILRIPGFK